LLRNKETFKTTFVSKQATCYITGTCYET
jgi:hypothetical protein